MFISLNHRRFEAIHDDLASSFDVFVVESSEASVNDAEEVGEVS